jgi:TIR domain
LPHGRVYEYAMSVSMYHSQVDRLIKDIADLQKKQADESSKATKARGDALRVANSISRTTSESMLRQKQRDIQRHEEKAAGHEKRVAQYADQIASKRRALTSAEASLSRAQGHQRQKDEREAKRKREQELRDIREIERARRLASDPFPAALTARPPEMQRVANAPKEGYEYDVCLTFAGENRDYVEMVARGLQAKGVRVFYDEDETTTLWGKNLVEYFDWVYRKASRYCVMFISEHYAKKPWTRHERRSALARALEEDEEYILPARFDDTELEGLPPTVGYLDLAEIAPATLIEHILKKLNPG